VACLSAITIPVCIIFTKFCRGAAHPELRSTLNVAALLLPVLMAKYLSVAALLGLQRIRRLNIANVIQAIGLLVLMCVNLFLFHAGARGALLAYLVSETTMTVVAFGIVKRTLAPAALLTRPPGGLFRASAKYGLQGHVGSVLVLLMYRYDVFLVLSFAGLRAQGLYSIAVIPAEKLSHITQSMRIVLFPKLPSWGKSEADELTPIITRNAFLMTVVAPALRSWTAILIGPSTSQRSPIRDRANHVAPRAVGPACQVVPSRIGTSVRFARPSRDEPLPSSTRPAFRSVRNTDSTGSPTRWSS
jgi:O-antigen/teichoic acid export membrane protein